MQVVKPSAVDPKHAALYGSWASFTKIFPSPKVGDVCSVSVFVIDTSKNNEKTRAPSASNNLESSGEPVGAYVEVSARVTDKPPSLDSTTVEAITPSKLILPPPPGRVFLRFGDRSYREVDGKNKPSSISLKIESETDFPNLNGKVVFAEIFN